MYVCNAGGLVQVVHRFCRLATLRALCVIRAVTVRLGVRPPGCPGMPLCGVGQSAGPPSCVSGAPLCGDGARAVSRRPVDSPRPVVCFCWRWLTTASLPPLPSPTLLQTVNFEQGEDQADGRKKYLTAKYGSHQMALIRKRLHVEMWLLEEMAKLYRSGVSVANSTGPG